jgi:hypothetical protein
VAARFRPWVSSKRPNFVALASALEDDPRWPDAERTATWLLPRLQAGDLVTLAEAVGTGGRWSTRFHDQLHAEC